MYAQVDHNGIFRSAQYIAMTVRYSNDVERAAYRLDSLGGMPTTETKTDSDQYRAFESLVNACESHPCHPEALAIVARVIPDFNY